jgi:hypothetical protein
MKASQHWKHRLKKKFGMGKQAKVVKKYKYAQIESTKKIDQQQNNNQSNQGYR